MRAFIFHRAICSTESDSSCEGRRTHMSYLICLLYPSVAPHLNPLEKMLVIGQSPTHVDGVYSVVPEHAEEDKSFKRVRRVFRCTEGVMRRVLKQSCELSKWCHNTRIPWAQATQTFHQLLAYTDR